uniref:Pentatricopeptide repeat-containing protein n=1 Tax=Ananas comosus var. bracteatus TaxID=296719 RepID=A0A6V7P480_ANACO|nr:unnamed protein product [Ananas comosus var. bracteatus]
MISLLKRRHLPPINPSLHLHLKTLSTNTIKHLPKPQELSNPNPFLPLLHSCPNLFSLKQIHALLAVHGLIQNLPLNTKLVSSYCAFESLESARKVFDEIPDPDLYSWKVMLRWYVVSDRYVEAIGFYGRRMRQCLLVEDNVVFSLVLKACVKSLDIDEGKKVHGHVVKVGNPDCFVLNCLVDMYAKCGDIECARRVFDRMRGRNVVSWTSIICGYVRNGRAEEGLVLFNEMRRESVEPSEHTLASLLTACATLDALHQGKWIHGYGIKVGVNMNSFVGTALLDMYVKCGDVTDARDVFDELYDVDIISWTAMIVGYTQTGRPLEALRIFGDKNFAGIIPNSITVASVLSASAQIRNLNFGRSIHVLGIKLGVENSPVVVNSLVDMYAKCRALSDANRIFKGSQNKDVITWNSLITGCAQNDLGYEALSLFNQMRLLGCSPDAVTLVSALSASASLGALQVGSSFHGYALKCAFLFNIYVNTALLNLYNKCGIWYLLVKCSTK